MGVSNKNAFLGNNTFYTYRYIIFLPYLLSDHVMFLLFTDGDTEKPQAKKRRTEDAGSTKSTQNGKKRKREEENEV